MMIKRIVMEPVKFADNLFTRKRKYSWQGVTGEFLQTVRILPDGRLEVTNPDAEYGCCRSDE